MRRSLWQAAFLLLTFSLLLLSACEQQQSEPQPAVEPALEQKPAADLSAGKAIAEQTCANCHGLDGATSSNGAPFIAGQQSPYMVNALQNYQNDIRKDNQQHESIKAMDEAAIVNVAAYYNSLNTDWKPQQYIQKPKSTTVSQSSINAGKHKATACFGCHGEDGNTTLTGIPSLAGLQYDYIKTAINAYFKGDRQETKVIMKNFKHAVSQKDIADLAAFFSSQKTLRSPLPASGNVRAGKQAASQQCSGCHGAGGNSINPTMPSLTGQNQEYLIKAIKAYRSGKRKNAMMQTVAKNLKDSTIQNISAYFASQQPKKVVGQDAASGPFDPLGDGAKIAASCNGCHGNNGNSTNKGIPSLSRLHPVYLTAAIKAYQNGIRKNNTMKSLVSLLSDMDIEKVALYYATQEPTASTNAKPGNPEQAEDLATACNGCHGENGNSTDHEVPTIAGQDALYLATAITNYASGARENETMANAVKELNKEQIRNVAAYFAGQTPVKLEGIDMPSPPEELSQKCDRCHGENGLSDDPTKPRLEGQIQAYLEKALKDYYSGNRESTAMHAMAAVLSLSEIKAIAAYYSAK